MLASVLGINTGDSDFSQWSWNHYLDHREIRDAIQTQKHFNLEVQEIDVINFNDLQSWLERHQIMHNEMNAVFELDGNDLTVVDFRDLGQRQSWLWLNFFEHRNVRAALKI